MEHKSTAMWKELNETPSVLGTLRKKNAAVLEAVGAAARKAGVSFVCTAARGTSDHAMMYLKYIVESELGIPVASCAPSAVTMYGAKMNFARSLVVGCSQSGKAADVIEIVKAANASGAVTVAVTNDPSSPLAQAAQFSLDCGAGPETSVAATKTFCSQLYLAALLCETLGGKAADARLGEALAAAVSAIDAATDEMAKDYVGAQDCFVLGRGVTAAVAFECALKLQETCYIRARAYHGSDFYHGPMAMVGQGTKVILFASKHSLAAATDGVHRADFLQCADKMLELGADLTVFTDDAEAFAGKAAKVVSLPSLGAEDAQIFAFAMAAQMLACKVSLGRGLSPDAPRALKKVTITR